MRWRVSLDQRLGTVSRLVHLTACAREYAIILFKFTIMKSDPTAAMYTGTRFIASLLFIASYSYSPGRAAETDASQEAKPEPQTTLVVRSLQDDITYKIVDPPPKEENTNKVENTEATNRPTQEVSSVGETDLAPQIKRIDYRFISIEYFKDGLSSVNWYRNGRNYRILTSMDFRNLANMNAWDDYENGYSIIYFSTPHDWTTFANQFEITDLNELPPDFRQGNAKYTDSYFSVFNAYDEVEAIDTPFLDWFFNYYDTHKVRLKDEHRQQQEWRKNHPPEPKPYVPPVFEFWRIDPETRNSPSSETGAILSPKDAEQFNPGEGLLNSIGYDGLPLIFRVLASAAIGFIPGTPPDDELTAQEGASEGTFEISWIGKAAHTYFIQHSPDLIDWFYLPIIESGNNEAIIWGGTSNQDSAFFRLLRDDTATTDPVNDDFDNDGVSNWDEIIFSTNPLDYFNGNLPDIAVQNGNNQHGASDEILDLPLVVRVYDSQQNYENAPVLFQMTSSSGSIDTVNDGTYVGYDTVEVLTDENGLAQVYLKVPTTFGSVASVSASIASGGGEAIVDFYAVVDQTIPYTTGFETTDGFAEGALHNQQGWQASGPETEISTEQVNNGVQAVKLGAGDNFASFNITGTGIVTVTTENSVYLTSDGTFDGNDPTLPELAADIVSYDPTRGIMAYDGNGSGGGSWIVIDQGTLYNNQWVDLKTVNHYNESNPTLQFWELYVGGILKATNLGFKDNAVTHASSVHFENHKATAAYLDDVSINN